MLVQHIPSNKPKFYVSQPTVITRLQQMIFESSIQTDHQIALAPWEEDLPAEEP